MHAYVHRKRDTHSDKRTDIGNSLSITAGLGIYPSKYMIDNVNGY